MLSDAIEALKQELEQADGGRLLPATEGDLEEAGRFGFPDVLLDFYRQNAPDVADGRVELWRSRPASGQRIWSVQNAVRENRDYVPGTELFPLGYVVFASNMFGDAYCIDTVHVSQSGDFPVVLFPHDQFAEGTSLEVAERYRLEVAANLEEFLRQFARRTLMETPRYD
jgi:SMI1 / KNR4 family (SUKH-1)